MSYTITVLLDSWSGWYEGHRNFFETESHDTDASLMVSACHADMPVHPESFNSACRRRGLPHL